MGASRPIALDRLQGILGSIADAHVMLVVSRATSYIEWSATSHRKCDRY